MLLTYCGIGSKPCLDPMPDSLKLTENSNFARGSLQFDFSISGKHLLFRVMTLLRFSIPFLYYLSFSRRRATKRIRNSSQVCMFSALNRNAVACAKETGLGYIVCLGTVNETYVVLIGSPVSLERGGYQAANRCTAQACGSLAAGARATSEHEASKPADDGSRWCGRWYRNSGDTRDLAIADTGLSCPGAIRIAGTTGDETRYH